MDKIKIKDYKELPIDQITVSEENVRKTEQTSGLEELKGNIERIGLIEPIVVIKKSDNKYEVVVGQRRFLAIKASGGKQIPSVIIENINDLSKKIVSLSENAQRRQIPYSDTIEACNAMFKAYPGKPSEKIKSIAKDLSLPIKLVTKYLAYQLVPKRVREMVERKEISPAQAFKITTAMWPNEEKIIKVSEYYSKLTPPEWKRALTISKTDSKLSANEIIEAAKKAPDFIKFEIVLETNRASKLLNLAEKRHLDPEDLIEEVISNFIEGRPND